MVSSWEGSASTNVPRIPVAPLIMGRVDEDISTRSPELGEQMSWNKNHLSRAPADACIPPPPICTVHPDHCMFCEWHQCPGPRQH